MPTFCDAGVSLAAELVACRFEPPARGLPWVVIVQSGRMSSLDDDSQEAALYHELEHRLVAHGYGVLQVAFPERRPEQPPNDADLMTRTSIVEAAIERHAATGPLVFVGTSLGGQSVLRILASERGAELRVLRAVLIGVVCEQPCTILNAVPQIHLVYGENDGVAYYDTVSGLISQVTPPPAYAQETRRRMIVRRSQEICVHVVPGASHTLGSIGMAKAADLLVSFIVGGVA